MHDQNPWFTRIGIVVFILLPMLGFYADRQERARMHTMREPVVKTEIKTTPVQPPKSGRKRIVIVEQRTPQSVQTLYEARMPPETITWHVD